MTLDLAELDGGLRARLDEADWAAAVASADVAVEGPLRPALESSGVLIEPALAQAVGVAIGGPALAQLTTASRDRGLAATVGCDGRSCAGVARVVLPAGVGGSEATAVPGVEVSAFTPERLVAELLRLFPPDRPLVGRPDHEPLVVPQTVALMLSRALRDDDEAMALEIARSCGFDEVPELLRELDREVSANATLVFRPAPVEGRAALPRVRQWLQSSAGWVAISVAGGRVEHRPVDRAGIRASLVEELAIMLERSPAVAG